MSANIKGKSGKLFTIIGTIQMQWQNIYRWPGLLLQTKACTDAVEPLWGINNMVWVYSGSKHLLWLVICNVAASLVYWVHRLANVSTWGFNPLCTPLIHPYSPLPLYAALVTLQVIPESHSKNQQIQVYVGIMVAITILYF